MLKIAVGQTFWPSIRFNLAHTNRVGRKIRMGKLLQKQRNMWKVEGVCVCLHIVLFLFLVPGSKLDETDLRGSVTGGRTHFQDHTLFTLEIYFWKGGGGDRDMTTTPKTLRECGTRTRFRAPCGSTHTPDGVPRGEAPGSSVVFNYNMEGNRMTHLTISKEHCMRTWQTTKMMIRLYFLCLWVRGTIQMPLHLLFSSQVQEVDPFSSVIWAILSCHNRQGHSFPSRYARKDSWWPVGVA